MRVILYVFSSLGFLFLTACSEAVPTVTDLSSPTQIATPSDIDDTSLSVNSGGGVMNGTSYRIRSKLGPSASVLTGSNYKIKVTGDN